MLFGPRSMRAPGNGERGDEASRRMATDNFLATMEQLLREFACSANTSVFGKTQVDVDVNCKMMAG